MQLPNRIHAALIRDAYADELVGHISRDSTAIEAREKPVPKNQESTSEDVKAPPKKRKRGRPKKGEQRPKEPRRLEKQLDMDLDAILDELPKDCTVGCKRNAKGYTNTWAGFTLHMDSADGGIPISCVVTSASLHDSQVAIALARMTGQRVQYCYELMDSAYDAKDVYEQSRSSGHVAMIDPNPRKKKPSIFANARRDETLDSFRLSGFATGNERPWSGRLGASKMSLVRAIFGGKGT